MVHSPSERGLPKVMVKVMSMHLPSELHGFQTWVFSSANCLNVMGGLPVVSMYIPGLTGDENSFTHYWCPPFIDIY
jgi:hypothetical protein